MFFILHTHIYIEREKHMNSETSLTIYFLLELLSLFVILRLICFLNIKLRCFLNL